MEGITPADDRAPERKDEILAVLQDQDHDLPGFSTFDDDKPRA